MWPSRRSLPSGDQPNGVARSSAFTYRPFLYQSMNGSPTQPGTPTMIAAEPWPLPTVQLLAVGPPVWPVRTSATYPPPSITWVASSQLSIDPNWETSLPKRS